ncbi:MAG TPA: CDP-diacylglycerol--glycerol-3-phosphate 3-phosphatidyltransferase [Firmicutes bacterium]|jgi:CDP-diacylglycerol--glycerol-3-phosphate 3-phosphatidyltransferase|uniref:CDP-diacylglycerol--glycerol-3-phosphate 3-phosphatidyltransferase n=1 Tax=Gelria sp. Kuro-4 TaxID=2796927 RepID=UPI0019AA2986|nr:CDP-diacylglycerol--glycerol-3-phosphate 3-phosphatidyltransferase [Gelria sp. Kuro-4]MDI3522012.1 CDP-diacylglycerol---glycerol-3-phosphate 3-phosphatidyltransferase [Bacillota bacterium]BCV25003.1 CDP-diacylglycerol--glycerol-3-phosphate 3-phosphatidyltransferase [Gelria sp. Kuro-4]HHV56138.1 CDP-diacylglycerol--glycerol-3-phosphate 3-phosphatidyltransferase [Bacillota bacterium]
MNLPNKLTLARIILVPVFMVTAWLRLPYADYLATAVFVVAALTDTLDGYLARRRQEITRFGKLLDPLADKLLVSAALLVLVEGGRLGAWVAMIIIGREFAVTGLRAVAAAEGIIIAASRFGKLKTVFQIIAIAALLLRDYPFRTWHIPFAGITMSLAVVFTVASGLDYFFKGRELWLPSAE